MGDERYFIEDPTKDHRASAFLYIPLFAGDIGRPNERAGRSEIAARAPDGVQWGDDTLVLMVGNSGFVSSDLIRVDFEFRICTAPMHGPADGFVVDHAGEERGSTSADITRLDYLDPRTVKPLRIALPDDAQGQFRDGLANLYFRARVSSVMTRPRPADQWNFERDAAVTEATFRIAP